MLSNASSRSSKKSSIGIRYDIILVLYPSLWFKNMRLREIFLVKVISKRLNENTSTFLKLNIFKFHIILDNSDKASSRRSSHSNNFILYTFQISKLFKSFYIFEIFLIFNMFFNLNSQFILDFWIFTEIKHHTS